jgi:hypothetical protein
MTEDLIEETSLLPGSVQQMQSLGGAVQVLPTHELDASYPLYVLEPHRKGQNVEKNNVTRRPSNLYERVILVQGQC